MPRPSVSGSTNKPAYEKASTSVDYWLHLLPNRLEFAIFFDNVYVGVIVDPHRDLFAPIHFAWKNFRIVKFSRWIYPIR